MILHDLLLCNVLGYVSRVYSIQHLYNTNSLCLNASDCVLEINHLENIV
jgi:hypothetical protein